MRHFAICMVGGLVLGGLLSCVNADRMTKEMKQRKLQALKAEMVHADQEEKEVLQNEIRELKNKKVDRVKEGLDTAQKVARYIPGAGEIVTGILGLAGTAWGGYRAYRNGRSSEALSAAIDEIGDTIEEDKDGKLTKEDAKRLTKNVADRFGVREDIDKLYRGLKKKGVIKG